MQPAKLASNLNEKWTRDCKKVVTDNLGKTELYVVYKNTSKINNSRSTLSLKSKYLHFYERNKTL